MKTEKIDIPKNLESDTSSLSESYYWKNGIFIVRSHYNKYFSISFKKNVMEVKSERYIAKECPNFYKFILKIQELERTAEVVTILSEFNQFTYKILSRKNIGFIDFKNNIHIVTSYERDDIHAIYFMKNKFIIIRCKTIETVIFGTKNVILQAEELCEFRESSCDLFSNTIYVMSRLWKRDVIRMTLYSVKI